MITLELGFPPSINNYKKIGHMTRTATGKLYQTRVNSNETKMFYYESYMLAKRLKRLPGSSYCFTEASKLEVHVEFYPPHNKSWDLDNRIKILIDGLMHSRIVPDDKQIYRLVVEKRSMIEHGKSIVTIKEI